MTTKEGKTKVVSRNPNDSSRCNTLFKDVVTWEDIHSEPMKGKGAWSNTTNANICELLRAKGEPVAFLRAISPKSYEALYCRMIPLEVIVRGQVDKRSSYLARNPDAAIGVPFPEPVIEFFLKTDGPEWRGIPLPKADPLITRFDETGIWVHHPKKPVAPEGEIFIPADQLDWDETGMWPFAQMEQMSRRSFAIVSGALLSVKFRLKDWKEEYGYTENGTLVHADSYDNDSWRLEDEFGREYSKQVIRDRGVEGIEDSKGDYAFIAELTGKMLETALAA